MIKLLNVREVAQALGLSPRQVWRLCAAQKIPAPILVGYRSRRWREADLTAFIQAAVPAYAGLVVQVEGGAK